MRQGSVPPNPNALGAQQPGTHFRRESNTSVQGDNVGGPGRGNYQGNRNSRDGHRYGPHGNHYNNQMGYPPNNQFRNGPGQGRGMPPSFQPQRGSVGYPNSPQPPRGSPAMVPSLPGTPNMPPAQMQPNIAMGASPNYHYGPPMGGHHQQQVQPPFLSSYSTTPAHTITTSSNKAFPPKASKKQKSRREGDKPLHQGRRSDSARGSYASNNHQQLRRLSNKWTEQPSGESSNGKAYADSEGVTASLPTPHQPPHPINELKNDTTLSMDLSPGNYENILLTLKNQTYGFPPQQPDPYGRSPYGAYNQMPYMPPPQANSPAYPQNFVPPAYHQHSHSMSRTPSQPERPASANQQAPAVAMGSSNQQSAASRPAKTSKALQIKTPAGDILDTSTLKPPTSPALSSQNAKTPPVATSTPTPPPKSAATPSHSRTDSSATRARSNKEIQEELREKIKQATQSQNKEEKVEAPASTSTAAVEAKPEPQAEPQAEPQVEAKPEPAAEKEAPKAEEPKKDAKPEEPELTEEEEMERVIREMEEADRLREEAEKEHQKKRDAEKAIAKEKAEAERKSKAAEEDKKLKEQEREMERLEEEKEKKRAEAEASGKTLSVADLLARERGGAQEEGKVDSVADKLAGMKIGDKAAESGPKAAAEKPRAAKPAALNLAPLNTKPVEPPQPSAALQSLQSARFLQVMDQEVYPSGIKSPNPALNSAVAKKGKTFKYDSAFLLQFQKVFTEQPSLEFHQQVKNLIGDDTGRSGSNRAQTPGSARQGSRGGGGGAFSMGTFNAPPGRTLPSGTSSAERFAMSSGSMARPNVNPMASFQRPGGAFPASASMSRTSSQSNMGPNSPRQSSRNTRGSRRGDFNANREDKQAKTMPLTAGQDIKPIAVTSTGWKPTSISKKADASQGDHMDPEMVQRKVKAALNKMTPENFERISDQILVIASQSKDETDGRTLRQVIQLTFEKATDEAHWASMYAKFCKKMLETMNPDIRDERIKDKAGNVVSGGNLFRKYLLNRCQEEFERGWASEPVKEEDGADKKAGEAAMLSDEYYAAAAAKRRGLGLVQFIGELYKLGMLTERIMMECVHKLVDYKGTPDEGEIESLSKLLRTIGAHLDMSEKGRPMMDVYFQRIQKMVDMPELASRMKFMLMDVLDLRKSNWHSKEANKGPKTLEEVRAEAEAAAAAKAQETARTNQRGGGGGRPPAGRGDARNFSAGYAQQTSNQVGMDDLRRLKGTASRTTSGHVTLGPNSSLGSRSNSGRRMGPGGSLGRPGEDSGASSRTGTPPNRDSTSHSNAFR